MRDFDARPALNFFADHQRLNKMASGLEKLIIELDSTADRKIRAAIAKTFG